MTFKIPPGVVDICVNMNAFEDVEIKPDEKTDTTKFTTYHGNYFISQLKELLVFAESKYSAGMHITGKSTKITSFQTVKRPH